MSPYTGGGRTYRDAESGREFSAAQIFANGRSGEWLVREAAPGGFYITIRESGEKFEVYPVSSPDD